MTNPLCGDPPKRGKSGPMGHLFATSAAPRPAFGQVALCGPLFVLSLGRYLFGGCAVNYFVSFEILAGFLSIVGFGESFSPALYVFLSDWRFDPQLTLGAPLRLAGSPRTIEMSQGQI
jgi:hypothetical protein